jgi:hypothetical protein
MDFSVFPLSILSKISGVFRGKKSSKRNKQNKKKRYQDYDSDTDTVAQQSYSQNDNGTYYNDYNNNGNTANYGNSTGGGPPMGGGPSMGGGASGLKCIFILIAILVIMVGVIVAAYYIYDAVITKKVITDCAFFNVLGTGLVPVFCNPDRQYYESTCVKKCDDGFNHTTTCGCTKGRTILDCGLWGTDKGTPTTCPVGRDYIGGLCALGCPEGSKRTGHCSCESGSYIDDCVRFGKSHPPTKCPPGREFQDSACVLACPTNWKRKDICACETGGDVQDCDSYGKESELNSCPGNRQFHGLLCYDPCDEGMKRTVGCTCEGGETVHDCDSFGSQQPYQCGSGRIQSTSDRLCYLGCPYSGVRTARCTCDYGEGTTDEAEPSWACPDGFPYRGDTTCYKRQGQITDCNVPEFNGGVGFAPNSCPGGVFIGGKCYDNCPDPWGSNDWWRENADTCVYPGSRKVDTCVTAGSRSECTSERPLWDSRGVGYCCRPEGRLDFECTGEGDQRSDICSWAWNPGCPSGYQSSEDRNDWCYKGCPDGGTKSSMCGCRYSSGDPVKSDSIPSCPGDFPIYYSKKCHNLKGLQTNCDALNGGAPSLPDSCPDYQEDFASGCYGKCLPGYGRNGLCSCTNYKLVTNCTLYGNGRAVGDPLGPTCLPGQDRYGLKCYSGACPDGMSRTGPCACSDHKRVTNCTLYGDARYSNDPLGPKCEDGEEMFRGQCYPACPDGMQRVSECRCSNYVFEIDCSKYGDGRGYLDTTGMGPTCAPGSQFFGGICYSNPCPDGMRRESACTCSDYELRLDCDKYGDPKIIGDPDGNGPQCAPDFDMVSLTCVKNKCPSGYTRTAICSCQKNNRG